MATRAALKLQLRAMVGLASDDPLASDTVFNPIINQAYQSVVAECAEAAPDALSTTGTVTLTNGSGPTPADVYQIRAVRLVNSQGADLDRCPFAELELLSGAYAVTGVEAPFTVHVTDDVTDGTLWLAYTQGAPAEELADDGDIPALLPAAFHDVIALEAGFAAELGGEQRRPPELKQRWQDRKARLFAHLLKVGGPGPASRTRMVAGQGDWP